MFSEIRANIVFAIIFASCISTPQRSAQQFSVTFDNEYVTASVTLPPKEHPTIITGSAAIAINPFVRLFLPTASATPKSEALGHSSDKGIRVTFFSSGDLFLSDSSEPQDGQFIDIDLKSIPAKASFKDDAVKSDKAHNEVLLENDRIRVVRIHFAPGESGPMVDKRPRVIVAVTDSQATVTFPDGHSEPREMKAGTVSFGNAGRQATKNTGTTPLENIVVELKSK
jgi:hypothetical protein